MTAITPSERKPRSRRAILIGALGGLGAVAAHAMGRPQVAEAANGDPILVGQVASGTATTQLQYSSSFGSGLFVSATSASGGYGISGATNATGGGWAGLFGGNIRRVRREHLRRPGHSSRDNRGDGRRAGYDRESDGIRGARLLWHGDRGLRRSELPRDGAEGHR
jgi:hypothetical protein